nr:adenylate/guanylate cyclase domain-containing protein [uncultured Pseudodesulfovibrio sp.]
MRKKIPLYVNILTIFTVLVITIVLSVVAYGYKSNSDSAVIAAQQLLRRVGGSVIEKTQNLFDTAFRTVDTYVNFQEIGKKASIHSQPLQHIFFKFLEQNKDFTSIYIGFGDGDFFLVSSLRERNELKKNLKIPQNAIWYTQTISHLADGQRYELRKYMDAGFVTVGSSSDRHIQYDPRHRPWYKSASETDIATLSEIYIFSLSEEPGITVSRRFDAPVQGVIGVDLSLSNLSSFLKTQLVDNNSQIMLFDAAGMVYAYPDLAKLVTSIGITENKLFMDEKIAALGSPALMGLMQLFHKKKEVSIRGQSLLVDGVDYLVGIEPLPKVYGKKLFIGMASPESTFTGPIAEIGKQTLFVSLGMLFLFLPIIYFVAKRISRPLKILTSNVENIKAFKLDSPIDVQSNILEIRELSKSIETMREALKAFGSYIPTPLVKAMIVNDIVPTLGGDRREMTFLFSDIKDFTNISETLTAEQVTGSITNYLEDMSWVILQNNGTIDKYIGDSIMAFWNAPVTDTEHAADACLATLQCRDVLNEFNRRRRENNEPEFLTRMGVHTGEAIVGNIGSSDRMAYTAMGSAVNLASRLEGLNKYMGTDILVSETTRLAAGNEFLFRFAGKVIPKGTSTGMSVYELLGTKKDATGVYAPFSVNAEMMQKVKEWEVAIRMFLSRDFAEAATAFTDILEKYGSDLLVEKYLGLTHDFSTHPPEASWSGEQSFDVK